MSAPTREPDRRIAEAIGPVGVWSFALDEQPAEGERSFAREVETLGFGALWYPESIGSKEAFSRAGVLLAATGSITVATGIASIWARDAFAMAGGARALAEAYPGRFLLGLGVSHAPSVATRGHVYAHPLERMRDYLDAMDAARYDAPGELRPPRVLAALGDGMLRLAADRADGAHSYFVPVEHTARARAVLGPGPLLAVEQTAVLETDAAAAREIARDFAKHYLELPNYADNLRRLGYSAEDVAGGGSDRLIDAVIVHGGEDAIAARVRAHLEAGADHVCLQLLGPDSSDPRLGDLRRLAPMLLA
jgi:probable F420-dependent oxidoreductase